MLKLQRHVRQTWLDLEQQTWFCGEPNYSPEIVFRTPAIRGLNSSGKNLGSGCSDFQPGEIRKQIHLPTGLEQRRVLNDNDAYF